MKETGLALALAALLGLGFHAQSYQREIARLSAERDHRLEQLAADGQPLDPRETFPESVPDEENVVAGLRDAVLWIEQNFDDPYFAMYLLEPETYPIDDHPDWIAQRRSYLASAEKLLVRVEEALARPQTVGIWAWSEPLGVDWTGYMFASRLRDPLLAYSICAQPEDRTKHIVRALRIQFRVAESIDGPGGLGRSYPAISRGFAMEILHRQRQLPGFSATELLPLLDTEIEHQATKTYDNRWIREERAWFLWLLERRSNVHPSVDRRGPQTKLRDCLRMLDDCDLFRVQETTLANASRPKSDYTSIDEPMTLTKSINRARWLTRTEYVSAAVRLQLARTALRVRRHFEATGSWPDQIPKNCPPDPRTSKPFHYELVLGHARVWATHAEFDPLLDWDKYVDDLFGWDWQLTMTPG